MPPWGKGPNPVRIYDKDGYSSYLPNSFPLLDYIERCYVVDEAEVDFEEEFFAEEYEEAEDVDIIIEEEYEEDEIDDIIEEEYEEAEIDDIIEEEL